MPSSKKKQRYHSEPLPSRHNSESPDSQEERDADGDAAATAAADVPPPDYRYSHSHSHSHSHRRVHAHASANAHANANAHSHPEPPRSARYGAPPGAASWVASPSSGSGSGSGSRTAASSVTAYRPSTTLNLGTRAYPLPSAPASAWEDEEYPNEEGKRRMMGRDPAVARTAQSSKDPSDREQPTSKTHAPPDRHKMTSHRASTSSSQSSSNTPSLPPISRSTIPNTDGSSSPSSASSPADTPATATAPAPAQDTRTSRSSMPADRVESVMMHQRLPYEAPSHHHYYNPRPSPPPIATLSHSPSLASDRSSESSPAPTILPPLNPTHLSNSYAAPSPHRYSGSSYSQPPPPPSQHHHHQHHHHQPQYFDQPTVTPTAVFATPPPSYVPPSNNYGGHYGGYTATQAHVQAPPSHYGADPLSSQAYATSAYPMQSSMYGGTGGYTILYTDEAATKLSDRVRRRCHNCNTTDTSTWRRSSLHPGKVLCNKCGLFERTHGRDRPEQFPHKRGTLATPTFASRTPPSPTHDQAQVPQQQQSQVHGMIQSQNLPPAPTHPSLATSGSLPQIGDYLSGPGGGSSANASSRSGNAGNAPSGRGSSSSGGGGSGGSYDSNRHNGQSSVTGSPHMSMHQSHHHHHHQSGGSPRTGSGSTGSGGSPMMSSKGHSRHAQGGIERAGATHRISSRSPSPDASGLLRDSQSPRMSGLPGMPSDVGSDYSRS